MELGASGYGALEMRATLAENLSLGLLCLAMVMALARLMRGPSPADRIIALDLLAIVIVAFISSVSVVFDQPVYLDIATSLAIIAFIGTVAYSRLLLQGKARKRSLQRKS